MGTFITNMLTPENIQKIKNSVDVRQLKKQVEEINQVTYTKPTTPPNIKVSPQRAIVPQEETKKKKSYKKNKFQKPFFI